MGCHNVFVPFDMFKLDRNGDLVNASAFLEFSSEFRCVGRRCEEYFQ